MAFKGWLADDEYAGDDQHFIKMYFDFDSERECIRFYDAIRNSKVFDAVVTTLAECAVNGDWHGEIG